MWEMLGLDALGESVQSAVGYSIVAVAVIGFLHNLSAAIWAAVYLGPMGTMGNRELLPPEEGWGRRARRGLHNYLENTLLFALIVIVAQIFTVEHAALGAGAVIFAVGRALYLPVYLIGLPVVRTLTWLVSVVGLGMMMYALFVPSGV